MIGGAKSLVVLALSTALVAALSACGGGDDAPTPVAPVAPPVVIADLSDKYVGTWHNSCSGPATIVATGAVVSSYQQLVITKVSATSYSVLAGNVAFSGGTCAGAGTPVAGEGGSTVYTLAGTKTIGTTTVDKVTSPSGGITAKNIAYVNEAGPTLQLGSLSGGVDTDGYPNALETSRYAK